MTNRLSQSNSPYLLQHAENPVDWYPWSAEALQKAVDEDKPIFLSIGYAACHWCHVMAHESFEDPNIAAIMNEHFVNIKVDREERPDLDGIYMNAVVAMTGQGGWPMSVFLTPLGQPFYGGTYFPPRPRFNMPSFRDVLMRIVQAWQEEPDRIRQLGAQFGERLQGSDLLSQESTREGPPSEKAIEAAAMKLAQSYDWQHGGWGGAPKFPQPMVIDFLLRRALQGDKFALEVAAHALDAMAKGGMYDLVGGGFSRYSVDNHWLVPHFEKMLYDNAQLASAYLHAYLITGKDRYRQVCESTLDFVRREMMDPSGGFYSSLDADSEGEEGKFYVWTEYEIKRNLEEFDEKSRVEIFLSAYTITGAGNFEGANILQRKSGDDELAEQFNLPVEELQWILKEGRDLLFNARKQRVRPGTDDKALTAWNALMLNAFAEAARYLGRNDYLEVAIRNAEFILSSLHSGERLKRSWRKGRAQHNAYLEDYASLILGLLSLYQSGGETRWFVHAQNLAAELLAHFRDPAGGFFDTRDDHERLVTRPKDLQDNATPSGNALAAKALLELSAFTANQEYRDIAESMLAKVQKALSSYPTAFGYWLCAFDFAITPVRQVAILGDRNLPAWKALTGVLWETFRPHLVAALSSEIPDPGAPSLLTDRSPLDGFPTAYVCENFFCRLPVTTPQALRDQLAPFDTATG